MFRASAITISNFTPRGSVIYPRSDDGSKESIETKEQRKIQIHAKKIKVCPSQDS